MKDSLLQAVAAFGRFLIYSLFWQFVLFHLGRITLRVLSLGRYPRGIAGHHTDRIAMVGLLVLVCVWGVAALYNYGHPAPPPVFAGRHG